MVHLLGGSLVLRPAVKMYPPSGWPSAPFGRFFVTSVCTTVLSSGHSLRRAVVCMTAVKKDCGLKKPGNQETFGTARSPVQSWSCVQRCSTSVTHGPRARRVGYDFFSHIGGI